jgi:hypothetical protein
MNRYGRLAQAHWQKRAPQRYAALEDPEEFFQTLGETAAAQIATISDRLEQQLPADLPYQERAGQLRAIQQQAEELVLADLVYAVETESASLAAELQQMLDGLPSPAMIEDSLRRLRDQAEADAEREGRSRAVLDDEQQARQTQLAALLPLVSLDKDPEQMSEAELTDRILALRPFWDPQTQTLADPPQ